MTHRQHADVMHYINGEFVPGQSGQWFDNLDPYTNQPICRTAEGRKEDILRAVRAASDAFAGGPWRRMPAKERLGILMRIADMGEQEAEETPRLGSLDTGLPISQTRGLALGAAQFIRHTVETVKTRLIGEAYQVDDLFINYTIYKPIGVVGLITPWNAPFMMETMKIAPALATGNTCVLKPAEWAPLAANKWAELAQAAGVPPGVLNVVHGFGEIAGASLVAHPEVRFISFTGETTTGSEIIRTGADSLKKVSMELGGKSPLILFDDADLERALDAIVWGVFGNNGERCSNSTRLLVQQSILDMVEKRLLERLPHIRLGDPLDAQTEIGPLIHPRHRENVERYIESARAEGAKVVQASLPAELSGGNFVPPTLLLNANNRMKAVQEEIFGPVLAVIPFATEEEAIRLANDVKYGLAAYIWTRDIKRGHRFAQAVDSGMVWVNSPNLRDPRGPAGGMKASGIGREGGPYSFDNYMEKQLIHVAIGEPPIPKLGAKPVT